MRIRQTAGRGRYLHESVRKLTLTAEAPCEERMLRIFIQAFEGNAGYWCPIMWAAIHGRLPQRLDNDLSKLIDAVQGEYEAEVKALAAVEAGEAGDG